MAHPQREMRRRSATIQRLFKPALLPKSRSVQVAIIGELFDADIAALSALRTPLHAHIVSTIFHTAMKRIEWADQDNRIREPYPPNCHGALGTEVWP